MIKFKENRKTLQENLKTKKFQEKINLENEKRNKKTKKHFKSYITLNIANFQEKSEILQ